MTDCPLKQDGFCDKVNGNVTVGHCLEFCKCGENAEYWRVEIARRMAEIKRIKNEHKGRGRKGCDGHAAANREKQQAELIELAKEMELPSPIQQAKNLGKHLKEIWAYRKKTGRKYVSDEWRDQRLAICRACPKLITTGGKERCSLCGCGVAKGVFVWESKTRYEAMTCELGYWAEIDRVNGKIA